MPELKLENSLVNGRYEVFDRLSRGSYAEIFIARDREANGKFVVIKALNTSLQGTPDAGLERTLIENFQNEAIALDTLRHPNIILRMGHGTAADIRDIPFHYLVLEYMGGGDLLDLCRKRPGKILPIGAAVEYFRYACNALSFAHSKGFIHRDLKPNNFLLSEDKRILKVADFGVAKALTGEDMEVTRVGADIYAPPEHSPFEISGTKEKLTTSSDIYSLAKSFYTVICGRGPSAFRCDPITYFPDDVAIEPWANDLLRVLRKATEDEQAMRYFDVMEFYNDLASIAPPQPLFGESVLDEVEDDKTIVRSRSDAAIPKIQNSNVDLPNLKEAKTLPLKPAFEPALASPGAHSDYNSAIPAGVPEAAPVQKQRIVVELQSPSPPLKANLPPIGTDNKLNEQPLTRNENVQHRSIPSIKDAKKKYAKKTSSSQFNALSWIISPTFRTLIFAILMISALAGAGASVYLSRSFVEIVDFIPKIKSVGEPSEIEIVGNVAVRNCAGTGADCPIIGAVLPGSRHKVIDQASNGWYRIEVSQWDPDTDHLPFNSRGWVTDNKRYVRVVDRK